MNLRKVYTNYCDGVVVGDDGKLTRSEYIWSLDPNKKIYVEVLKGPTKGSFGLVKRIEPVVDDDGCLTEHASIVYMIKDDENTFWLNGGKQVQARHCNFMRTKIRSLYYINTAKKPQPKFSYHHVNTFGQELKIGSFVATMLNGEMILGTITKSARTTIRIEFNGKEYTPSSIRNTLVIEDVDVIKQALMSQMLSGWDGSMWSLPEAVTEKRLIDKATT